MFFNFVVLFFLFKKTSQSLLNKARVLNCFRDPWCHRLKSYLPPWSLFLYEGQLTDFEFVVEKKNPQEKKMKQSVQNNVNEINNPQINNSRLAGVRSLDQKYPNYLYYSAQSWVLTCFHECSCLCSGCWCTRCSGDTVEVLCFGAPAHRSSTPGQKDTSGKPA